jgi:ubiquinone/menaquinone biosynthesis C-methylase UbiE
MDAVKTPNKLTSLNTQPCPWWLLFSFDNPLRKLIHDPKKILADFVTPGDTVLDVGCGMGYFSLGLAELVGKGGRVIAADLQERMLAGLRKRAHRAGLLPRIQLHRSTPDRIGVAEPLDFVLAFWMVHEVREPEPFLREIYDLLRPAGQLLVVEPKIHVSSKAFEKMVRLGEAVGFWVAGRPEVRASRAVVFSKLK